jgi:hypothetical protein
MIENKNDCAVNIFELEIMKLFACCEYKLLFGNNIWLNLSLGTLEIDKLLT